MSPPATTHERRSPDAHAALPARPVHPSRFGDEDLYAATRLPVDRASTLIPDAYTSPEFFAVEQRRVFAEGWVAVGCTADLDRTGACLVTEVAGHPIFITRNRHGQL